MPKLKILSVLAGTIAALALSATPAFAEFESTAKPAQSQGIVHIKNSGELVIGNTFIKCPASGIEAQYHIQTKGQIKQQQNQTTLGPQLGIQVKSWSTGCTEDVLGTELPVEIKPCGLRLAQLGSTAATFGVSEACLIKIGSSTKPTCELQVPVGMETAAESGQGINVGLSKIELENSGTTGIARDNITEGGKGQKGGKIFVVQQPGHSLCPVATTETLELVKFVAEGANLNVK